MRGTGSQLGVYSITRSWTKGVSRGFLVVENRRRPGPQGVYRIASLLVGLEDVGSI